MSEVPIILIIINLAVISGLALVGAIEIVPNKFIKLATGVTGLLILSLIYQISEVI